MLESWLSNRAFAACNIGGKKCLILFLTLTMRGGWVDLQVVFTILTRALHVSHVGAVKAGRAGTLEQRAKQSYEELLQKPCRTEQVWHDLNEPKTEATELKR